MIYSMKFLSPEKSTIMVMHGILLCLGWCPLVATWNCQISYKNGYAGLLFLHLLPVLNLRLIVEMQPAQVFSVGVTLADVYLNWLNWFHFLILEVGLLVILKDCMIFVSPFQDVTRMCLLIVFFITQLGYDLDGFKFRFNKHLLTIGSF